MTERKELHPDIERFKQFMKRHPTLLDEMRRNNQSLQSLFEEWYVLGDEHERWLPYKEVENTQQNHTDVLNQVVGMFRQMNIYEVQSLLGQLSNVLANVQNVIQTFQRPSQGSPRREQDFPFSFRRD